MVRTFVLLTIVLGLEGCVTPSVEMPILDYKPPVMRDVVADRFNVSGDSVTITTSDGGSIQTSVPRVIVPIVKTFNLSRVKRVPDIGTGINRPEARLGDPWNIVLKRVRIQNHGNWISPGQIAVLVRVLSGGNGDNEPWVLAALETSVPKGAKLNFENLVVWSGSLTQPNVVLEVKVLNLTKIDKELVDQYATAAGQLAGAIPVYGSLFQTLTEFGTAINAARDDYEILLQYRKGFNIEARPRYAAYALVPSEAFAKWANQLWFDDSTQEVMAGESKLETNWLVVSIAKSAARAFEYKKVESAQQIVKLAEAWPQGDTAHSIRLIDESVKNTKSTAEIQRILNKVEFDHPATIIRALAAFKLAYLGDGAGKPPVIDSAYAEDFVMVLKSYFDEEFMRGRNLQTDADFQDWTHGLTTIKQDYVYDNLSYKWTLKLKETPPGR